jgi:hypothetical protein
MGGEHSTHSSVRSRGPCKAAHLGRAAASSAWQWPPAPAPSRQLPPAPPGSPGAQCAGPGLQRHEQHWKQSMGGTRRAAGPIACGGGDKSETSPPPPPVCAPPACTPHPCCTPPAPCHPLPQLPAPPSRPPLLLVVPRSAAIMKSGGCRCCSYSWAWAWACRPASSSTGSSRPSWLLLAQARAWAWARAWLARMALWGAKSKELLLPVLRRPRCCAGASLRAGTGPAAASPTGSCRAEAGAIALPSRCRRAARASPSY